MIFFKKKEEKPKSIDQLYYETEQAYFNGYITEKEYDDVVNELYYDEIREMEAKK